MLTEHTVDFTHKETEFDHWLTWIGSFIIQIVDQVGLVNYFLPVFEEVPVHDHPREELNLFSMRRVLVCLNPSEVSDWVLCICEGSFVILDYIGKVCQVPQL